MNKSTIVAAQEALERLSAENVSTAALVDFEVLRTALNAIAAMEYAPDWGVHVDGEDMYCESEHRAQSLLRFCTASNPDGGAHLIRRDQLRGAWTADETTKETHV